jgi:predicted PurR-regulated permease PerM
MIVYYILVDKGYLKSKFIEFFPPDIKEKATDIAGTISIRLGNYVRVQILSMVSVGIMMTIVLAILRVDYPIFLGLITGVLDIIPILGPTIALAFILLAAYPFTVVKIALIIGGFVLVQQLSNYVVRPVLFGKLMSVHPLVIFFALFMAQKFLGFWGVILSPALAATVCVLVDELYLKAVND